MRIEVNTSGAVGMASLNSFQSNMTSFISNTEKVIKSFKTVRSGIYDLPGGESGLQEAVEDISTRIQQEETKKENASKVMQKSTDFMILVKRVDAEVSRTVLVKREEFYSVNPWLRPPLTYDEKNLLQKAGSYIWDHTVGKVVSVVVWATDSLGKAWTHITDFYHEHEKLINGILLVGGAIVSIGLIIASGGLGLVPLLTFVGVSEGVAAVISGTVAVIAVVTKTVSTVLQVLDLCYDIDDPVFRKVLAGFRIAETISNGLYTIGDVTDAFKHQGNMVPVLQNVFHATPQMAALISTANTVVFSVTSVSNVILETIDIIWHPESPFFQEIKAMSEFVGMVSGGFMLMGTLYNHYHHITPDQAQAMLTHTKYNPDGVMGMAEYYPGADSNIRRELITEGSINDFYQFERFDGTNVTVSVDPVTGYGVSQIDINMDQQYVVLTGTHGGTNGGLSFDGPPPAYMFYYEDCQTFASYPNVDVVNVQDYIPELDADGFMMDYAKKDLQKLTEGKNVICAWCYSESSALLKDILNFPIM